MQRRTSLRLLGYGSRYLPHWLSTAVSNPTTEPELYTAEREVKASPESMTLSMSKGQRTPEDNQIPLSTGRPRLVILGSGWAACRLLRDIDPRKFDLTVISPRNHMVFTPLLASTTVGTLDPRSITVHVMDIQNALQLPQNRYYMANCENIDLDRRYIHCLSDDVRFKVHFDKLAICTGSQGSTFGIPGVEAYTHFLRDVRQSTQIRSQLIENLARAVLPGNSQEEFQRYLTVVVVGGGPTGVEFAGELCDFVREDLSRLYPHRARDGSNVRRVILIEAQEVLGGFDPALREYAAQRLSKQGVFLLKGQVQDVLPTKICLKDGKTIPFGLCVWSTGVGPSTFISGLPLAKTKQGRLAVDGYLQTQKPAGKEAVSGRIKPLEGVYALGDCCANSENPLPALAQVAEQQGRYLARVLNNAGGEKKAFVYRHLGSMATVGRMSAILQLKDARIGFAGFTSWVAWRSAYLTRLGTVRNRLYVAFNWSLTMVFGRDLSRW